MSKPRVISSPYTGIVKVVAPLLLLEELFRLAFALAESQAVIPPLALATHLGVIALFAWLFLAYLGLKRVALTPDALHVSSSRREIVVPLREVERVSQRLWTMHAVVIHLAHETELGRRVIFLPKRWFHWISFTHPIVDRLRDAVADARAAAQQPSKPGRQPAATR
jgi:hypothetical protein